MSDGNDWADGFGDFGTEEETDKVNKSLENSQ